MTINICSNGHTFEKNSTCPVCPICSGQEMRQKYGDELPRIGAPALRALDAVGVIKLGDIAKFSEAELLALHGMGPKAVGILKSALQSKGLLLADGK